MTSDPAVGEPTKATGRRFAPERRPVLVRLDPAVHDAMAHWARDELRSLNAQIEMVIRRALADAGRAPTGAAPLPRRGRPRKE